ncbi:MAG: AlpA family transcriptional regulator [Candidatus Thiodiazotropha taylori]|nr:AlpA family transcriptional regulator [Candidatus Thiodiazotropha taylori]
MNTCNHKTPVKLIRIKTVIELTGLSKSYIYDLSNRGLFPKSVQLIPGGTSVAWVESEITDWLEQRIQTRDTAMKSVY